MDGWKLEDYFPSGKVFFFRGKLLVSGSVIVVRSDFATRIAFAVPMYWVMDVTINILQTPYRALVSDLATKEQQIPMQARQGGRCTRQDIQASKGELRLVWKVLLPHKSVQLKGIRRIRLVCSSPKLRQVIFVFFMAIGNMIGYSIMKIWDVPSEHMLKLMLLLDHHSCLFRLLQSYSHDTSHFGIAWTCKANSVRWSFQIEMALTVCDAHASHALICFVWLPRGSFAPWTQFALLSNSPWPRRSQDICVQCDSEVIVIEGWK